MKNKVILIISIVLVSCVFTKQLKAVDFLNKCGETANTDSSSYCVGYLRGYLMKLSAIIRLILVMRLLINNY